MKKTTMGMQMEDLPPELRQADAWINWRSNPCGKPALDLAKLKRFDARQAILPCKGVDTAREPTGSNRRAALGNLEGAYHFDREFPGEIAGYYEGEREGGWSIEIYGSGPAWPVTPEPPKPDFMREADERAAAMGTIR